ncbi:OmpA family protein [Castellaniella sp.]|uniref:OmpA family protein n=1 Tax=Castellaniella sp. TaxID=1955812 RepID=UPI00356632EE
MNAMVTRPVRWALVGSLVLALGACANVSPKGQNTAIGAGAGAAIGAGLGALIGDSSKSALIGAGIGSAVGAVVGYNWDRIRQDVEGSGAADLGVAVTEMPDGTLRVNIPSNVSFATGKSTLQPALLPVLDSVARAMNQHPELRARALGYTDSTGTDAINLPLSRDRATAVTQYLITQGVSSARLSAEGMGASNPIGNNATVEGRALNRRVELYLYAVQQ